MPRIYLDNAATSWPKPEAVYAAVDHFQRHIGAASGRGAYAESIAAMRIVQGARRAIAELIGARDPQRIVFTLNGTDALNQAIHGALAHATRSPPVHVVTTVLEHNSVLRPLRAWEETGRVQVTRVRCGTHGVVSADDVAAALRPDTALVALIHASNVSGAIQPAAEVGRAVRRHGALFLLDAAQTLGEIPLDVEALNVDLLAAPGHKGLLGPLGTGVLYVRPGVEGRVDSTRQGGTGTQSEQDRQPDALPEKYEAGNVNVAGIAGLGAGAKWLLEQSVDRVRQEALQLTDAFLAQLHAIEGLTVHGPATAAERVGLVSVTLSDYDPQEAAATLDAAFGVQVRAGLHCAPLAHKALGTLSAGGSVRFSLGPFTTRDDVDAAVDALRQIVNAAASSG